MSFLSQTSTRRADASPLLVLVIVCAGVVLASLDLFIVNVALPDIARDLHERSLGDLSWILNAYAIVYASLLVLFGRLSESRRRENGFLLGVLVFTAASAACGAASSLTMLIAFRIAQAAGAALLTPTSLSLVLATSAPERRQSSVRAWTAIGGLAAALGPVVGGLLVAASWRWVFYVNVPIGLAAIAAGWRRLPRVPGHPVPRPDALGSILVTIGVGAVTLGLVKGNDWGWGSTATIVSLGGAALALALFALHCARARNPLIDASLFRIRAFTGSSVVAIVFSIAFGAMLLSLVLWCQQVWGWSALQTGLGVAPGPLMVPLFSFVVAGRLIARYGPGRVIAAGATIYAAGAAWWTARAGLDANYAGQMLPGMLMTGIGVGLTLPTFMSTGASALPPHSFATGSAVVNMLRQVGLAVGVAVLVAVIGAPPTPDAQLTAFQNGWIVIAGTALLAAVSGGILLRPRRERGRERESARWSGAAATPPALPERQ
ncbi:MAG TPA: DHA2 family efflux MFS transporter permease subunit [Solirubrobacteraceae bacterium]|nr:DHA2 family efflux MFS transporter permease subunit [Solirubrobacteraceae bacterium]